MRKYFRFFIIVTLFTALLIFTGCKTEPKNDETEVKTNQTSEENTDNPTTNEEEKTKTKTPDEETSQSETEKDDSIFLKLRVDCDEVGIYSVTFELNDNIADKGVIEMIYTGAKDTAEEGSIVNRYRVEYYKDTNGKFETTTYYNGNIDVKYHQKSSVKITNGFGALVRAGTITINYTPDGKETIEVFKAQADGKSTEYK